MPSSHKPLWENQNLNMVDLTAKLSLLVTLHCRDPRLSHQHRPTGDISGEDRLGLRGGDWVRRNHSSAPAATATWDHTFSVPRSSHFPKRCQTSLSLCDPNYKF